MHGSYGGHFYAAIGQLERSGRTCSFLTKSSGPQRISARGREHHNVSTGADRHASDGRRLSGSRDEIHADRHLGRVHVPEDAGIHPDFQRWAAGDFHSPCVPQRCRHGSPATLHPEYPVVRKPMVHARNLAHIPEAEAPVAMRALPVLKRVPLPKVPPSKCP